MKQYIKGKYFWILITIFITSALIAFIFIKSDISPPTSSYGIMDIYIPDTGKADAILITTDNSAVMIDTGGSKNEQEIVDFLISHEITRIDYLIITHFHKDHIGGASAVINNIEVAEVIVPDYGKDSKQYNRFIEAMEDRKLESIILKETLKITLDSTVFTVYPGDQEYYDFSSSAYDENENNDGDDNDDSMDVKENNYSVAVSINHGNNNFLFTGDAKAKRLKELLLLENIKNTEYDFLKVPQHGRYNKFSVDFIGAVRPKYAAITCSFDMPADSRVVAALEAAGTDIYYTANGNIVCESNGNELTISYK